jgi:hypothetical protein
MDRYKDILSSIQENLKSGIVPMPVTVVKPEDEEKPVIKTELVDEYKLMQLEEQAKKNIINKQSSANEMENETPEMEMEEYKEDFYEMSVGSIRAIASHAQSILNSLENPSVKENLTESWLQGKIAITEDYMRTIHDFIMYVSEAADSISAADRPGLWENIRKKREKEGKKYRPARPGEKDRPDPEQWKKLTK